MKKILQQWIDYKPSKEHALWFGAGCVVATLVVGFGLAGWVTGATARKMADESASASRHQLAAAVCAQRFMRATDAKARLAKLKSLEWYDRDDLVAGGGWATMPGEQEAAGMVAELCANRLAEQAEASARATPVSNTLK